MDAPPPAQAISRDDAINMLAQMDQMRARLFAFHPDLNLNRQQSMDYSFLPGSVDTSADPQAEAGTPSGTNPRALSSDSSVKFSVAPKAVLPIAEQPGLFHEIPQEEAATSASPSYRATVAVTTVMGEIPKPAKTVPEDGVDALSESECRAVKALIRSQLNAAHEAEAIRELIRTEVLKHSNPRGTKNKLPPLVDERNGPADGRAEIISSSQTLNMRGAGKGLDTPNHSSAAPDTPSHSSAAPAVEESEGDETPFDGIARAASSGTKKGGHHQADRRKRSMEAIDDHTGGIYPATAVAPGTKHHDEPEDEGWDSTAENAYGAFIHITLQSGITTALYKCAPMLITSVLIQFVFAYELYRALPSVESAPMFCYIPWDLQMAAVGVFVTLMLDNIAGMYDATRVCLTSTQWKNSEEGSEVQDISCGLPSRIILWILAVLTEITTWFGIFCSGVLFILTAESVDMVIRSTVAIMFVQNVDEIIFESCCSRQVKDSLRETRYRLLDPLGKIGIKRTQTQMMDHIYSLFLHLPFILLITAALVLGLRAAPDIDCLHVSL